MKKDKKQPKETKGKKSSGKSFLKKRAPIYLAVITLVIVFIIPELTAGTLQDHIPDDLIGSEKQALDLFLSYRGPNESGLNTIDVLAEKISEDYPDEKIYDKKDTSVRFYVNPIEDKQDEYLITLEFKTKKESTIYEWNVNIETGEINGINSEASRILDIVDYSG